MGAMCLPPPRAPGVVVCSIIVGFCKINLRAETPVKLLNPFALSSVLGCRVVY
jgi:hypothetical protein